MKRSRRRMLMGTALVLAIAAGVFWVLHRPAGSFALTISEATTHVLGPINDDGTVNYVAALNGRLGQGVTQENNAALLILRALGPTALEEKVRSQVLSELRISSLPVEGEYFVGLKDYVEAQRDGDVSFQETSQLREELLRAQQAPWRTQEHRLLARWLEANQKPLLLLCEAAKKPRCYIPCVSPSKPAQMVDSWPLKSNLREPAYALDARAMMRLGLGDIEGALGDAMALHALGRQFARQPWITNYVTGLSVDTFGCLAQIEIATSRKLTAAQTRAVIEAMGHLPALRSARQVIDFDERLEGLDVATSIVREASLGRSGQTVPNSIDASGINANVLLRYVNEWYDRQVSAFDELAHAKRRELLGDKSEEVSRRAGNQVLALVLPAADRVDLAYTRARTWADLAKLALALAAFHAEHGSYPKTLDALAPDYLSEVPVDRFADAPLHYHAQHDGYILYSVGPNLKDDGGRIADDNTNEQGDMVVQVTPDPNPLAS
jgi:hypothetical protein